MTTSPDLTTDRDAFEAQVRRHARELREQLLAAATRGEFGSPADGPRR